MSFHAEYEEWLRLAKKETCCVCREEPSPGDHTTIWEFPTSWLEATPRTCLKGTCWLLLKPHAVELYDLDDADLLAYMKEAQMSALAIKRVTGAVKINYEIHGNTVPHMHMHLFPRYLDDPFPGQPIDYRLTEMPPYGDGEFEEYVASLRSELSSIAGNQRPVEEKIDVQDRRARPE
jgi:diadenosine tetraphosphate (Ap4A) HIT family hydrolase